MGSLRHESERVERRLYEQVVVAGQERGDDVDDLGEVGDGYDVGVS